MQQPNPSVADAAKQPEANLDSQVKGVCETVEDIQESIAFTQHHTQNAYAGGLTAGHSMTGSIDEPIAFGH